MRRKLPIYRSQRRVRRFAWLPMRIVGEEVRIERPSPNSGLHNQIHIVWWEHYYELQQWTGRRWILMETMLS